MSTLRAWMPYPARQGLVTVIIPTYNRAELLLEALQSVRAQTYRPLEVLVVDDGSSDGTEVMVAEFAGKIASDLRLNLQYHKLVHAGASPARNYGLNISHGEFIQFLDSDDLLHPDKIALQVQGLRDSGADLVWSGTVAFNEQPDWQSAPLVGARRPAGAGLSLIKPFIQKSLWRTESGLYRRSLCQAAGPWQSLAMFQDWEYHIRMLATDPLTHYVPGNLAAARQHDGERIGNKWCNGSGLQGALAAIQLAEQHSQSVFAEDRQWRQIMNSRYAELAEQAQLCHQPELARRATANVQA